MQQHPLLAGFADVCKKWGWFLALGIALLVLGTLALLASGLTTLASVLMFGWLLMIGGAFEAAAAFWARQWSGFFLHLLSGVLSLVTGALVIGHPVAGAAGLTLILALMFLTTGLFRIIAAASIQHPNWGWAAFDGFITVVLGAMIWAEWPSSALWVIGTFVGIDLIFRGWAWVMFALAAKQFCQRGEAS